MVSDDGRVRNVLQLTETVFLAGIYVVIELIIDTRKLLFTILFVKKIFITIKYRLLYLSADLVEYFTNIMRRILTCCHHDCLTRKDNSKRIKPLPYEPSQTSQ